MSEDITMTGLDATCSWESCERIGFNPSPAGLMCSQHHPAGRAHIKVLREEVERLRRALEAIADGRWAVDSHASRAREPGRSVRRYARNVLNNKA